MMSLQVPISSCSSGVEYRPVAGAGDKKSCMAFTCLVFSSQRLILSYISYPPLSLLGRKVAFRITLSMPIDISSGSSCVSV
jgi:hypothetical protein